MPGDERGSPVVYILDDNTISQVWRSYHQNIFPSLWERFNRLVRHRSAVSVDAVRDELLANRRVSEAVAHLERLNPSFFTEPTIYEQHLVQVIISDPRLSSAANRWLSKSADDADPYLIAKGLTSPVTMVVVTEESQDLTKTASIFYVCHYYGMDCINHQQMMGRLGWVF